MTLSKQKYPTHELPQFSGEKHYKSPDFQTDVEIERNRSQSDFTDMKVSPMRTSFHFFVDDVQEAVRTEAREEYKGDVDFLLYSNMNARVIKKWNELPSSTHVTYMGKEEEDRVRFQNEDEIASRHCATLTARASRGDDDGDGDETVAKKRSSPSYESESPPKRNKSDEGQCSEDALRPSNEDESQYLGEPLRPSKDEEGQYSGEPPRLPKEDEGQYSGEPPRLPKQEEVQYSGEPPRLPKEDEGQYSGEPLRLPKEDEGQYSGEPPRLPKEDEGQYSGEPLRLPKEDEGQCSEEPLSLSTDVVKEKEDNSDRQDAME
jgi:hypothetical protein